MLPLSLLRAATGHPVLVELKNAETMNGHLFNCDSWMNMNLRDVICTSRDGDRFWKMRECYVRGNTIKALRVPDEILEKVKEESAKQRQQSGKPGRGGRGRGMLGGKGEGRGKGKGNGEGKGERKPKSDGKGEAKAEGKPHPKAKDFKDPKGKGKGKGKGSQDKDKDKAFKGPPKKSHGA